MELQAMKVGQLPKDFPWNRAGKASPGPAVLQGGPPRCLNWLTTRLTMFYGR